VKQKGDDRLAIFKFLFGKPLIDHKIYIFIYSFFMLGYIFIGTVFMLTGWAWHFLLVWGISYPIAVRVNHTLFNMLFNSLVHTAGRRFNRKSVGSLIGMVLFNILFSIAFLFYAFYAAPNSYLVLDLNYNQIDEHTYEVSVGTLRGEFESELYVDIPPQEPNMIAFSQYEALVEEGSYRVELYHESTGDVVWSEEVNSNSSGIIEYPEMEGKHWFRLVADSTAKDVAFRLTRPALMMEQE
jgi:hypothetical protein